MKTPPSLALTTSPMTGSGMREIDAYLLELDRRLLDILGGDLVGVYLHGSAAMGAFVPSRSDIDVLAVSKVPLSAPTKAAVADALSEAWLPCPGVGLEMSIVTVDSARTASDTPRFELHMDTLESRVVDGTDHLGDPDLLAHFAMLGRPPASGIAERDRQA